MDAASELVAALGAHAKMSVTNSSAAPVAPNPVYTTLLTSLMKSRQKILVPVEATFRSGEDSVACLLCCVPVVLWCACCGVLCRGCCVAWLCTCLTIS